MKKVLINIIFYILSIQSYGQEKVEQKALDYFDKIIKVEFSNNTRELTYYFMNESTKYLSELDAGTCHKYKGQRYHPDFEKLNFQKCDTNRININAIELIKPKSFKYKKKYKYRPLVVHLWKIKLWERNNNERYYVYVDRAVKCGKLNLVNIRIYPIMGYYWYNINIFIDENGNIVEWFYIHWVS